MRLTGGHLVLIPQGPRGKAHVAFEFGKKNFESNIPATIIWVSVIP